MNSIDKSCLDYETNSLGEQQDRTECDLLLETLSILRDQVEHNKECMEKLVDELNQLNLKFTYQENGILAIDKEYLTRMDDFSRVKEIELSYNTYNRSNLRISSNITNIGHTFFGQLAKGSFQKIYDEIEKKGLSILKAQEIERSRIACDLHDSIVQNLANLVHKAELCMITMDQDVISAKLDLQLMMLNIREVIDDIRSIIYNLRPMALEDLGLGIAVERFLSKFQQEHKVSVKFTNELQIDMNHDFVISITLFRIIQEACSNAVLHGKATHIQVNLMNSDQYIYLQIKDNGEGFDVEKINHTKKSNNSGFGLSIMKERICLLSGRINIYSKIKEGTTIDVKVPIKIC